jgi:hypothetical protein
MAENFALLIFDLTISLMCMLSKAADKNKGMPNEMRMQKQMEYTPMNENNEGQTCR